MSVEIDAGAFHKRVASLQQKLAEPEAFNGVTSLLSILGKGEQETDGTRTSVLHIWLLGYPFANTAISVTRERVYILTSSKQAKHLESLRSKDVEILLRPKDPEECRKVFAEHFASLEQSGPIGVFADKPESIIAVGWREELSKMDWEQRDVARELASLLSIKDEDELRAIRTASKVSRGFLQSFLVDRVTAAIDEGKKVSHKTLANEVLAKIDDDKFFRSLKLGSAFDPSLVDWAVQPVVQSGGEYSLDEIVTPSDQVLSAGVILCTLGFRYRFYSSLIARTYLINPTQAQESNYSLVLGVYKRLLAVIKDGVKCSEVHAAGLAFVEEKAPQLAGSLGIVLGFGIGIDTHEANLDLAKDNETTLADGTTLVVRVTLKDLDDEESKQKYSLLVADTLRVTLDEPIVFSDAPMARNDVVFFLEEYKPDPETLARKRKLRATTVVREDAETDAMRLQNHQVELRQQLQERGLKKYVDTAGPATDDFKPEFVNFESYKRETQLPLVRDLRLSVDVSSNTILLPISGRPVPFHIKAYKNGSKTEEGEYVYLRLNFTTPDAARPDEAFENPEATFVKSITVRSRDTDHMTSVFKQIQDLKKESVKREASRKEMADLVKQEKLIEFRDQRPVKIENVFVRPLAQGKRIPGTLEIHKNGVRFTSPIKDQQIDVVFDNMESLFFQPCDEELIVLMHFHLRNPLLVGQRKVRDVQIYRDATEANIEDTSGRRRKYRYGDEDELEQEQEEKRMRRQLNKEFKAFAEQIAKASNGKVDVDSPFRELGFSGAPSRSTVFCQPTTDYLVQLVDTPFLVINLREVELVYLERVQFGLREFDLVFVFKDYSKPVSHINTIPMEALDGIKQWLDHIDIPFYEGPLSMTWGNIMKTIVDDPRGFYETGGWSFLGGEDVAAAEEGKDAGTPPEEESEYQASESDFDDDEENYTSDEESDFDDDEDDSDGSGEDWDDLDAEAEREDRETERRHELRDDTRRKRR